MTGGGSAMNDAGVDIDPLADAGPLEALNDGGFGFTEGPLWLAQEGVLQFSEVDTQRLWKFNPQTNSFSVFRTDAGGTNGVALDPQGRLVACEMYARRVTRTESDGGITVIADRLDGGRLNSPNDVTIRADGTIFFTDPLYVTPANMRDLNFQGVFRITPGGVLSAVITDIPKPNGIALSPDGTRLYVADIMSDQFRIYTLDAAGTPGTFQTFSTAQMGGGGGDGVTVDDNGNFYVSTPGGVKVYKADGTYRGRIVVPVTPTNVAFGDVDRRSLYITSGPGRLFRIRLNVPGKPY